MRALPRAEQARRHGGRCAVLGRSSVTVGSVLGGGDPAGSERPWPGPGAHSGAETTAEARGLRMRALRGAHGERGSAPRRGEKRRRARFQELSGRRAPPPPHYKSSARPLPLNNFPLTTQRACLQKHPCPLESLEARSSPSPPSQQARSRPPRTHTAPGGMEGLPGPALQVRERAGQREAVCGRAAQRGPCGAPSAAPRIAAARPAWMACGPRMQAQGRKPLFRPASLDRNRAPSPPAPPPPFRLS
jgi:hypothetical protein